MLLMSILTGTLVAGIGSVLLAALFSPAASSRFAPDMLSFAAGALLSTACLHLLPEAFESGVEAKNLGIALLTGLIAFFVLDKVELWHHGHEHHHDAEHDATGRSDVPAARGIWALLMGDSVHCFGDGLLIAAAFVADVELGALAALAVLIHEVPHHMGDLAVVRQGPRGRQRALLKVALAGTVTVLGGLAGYGLADALKPFLAYFLIAAASSFVYVALADLIPQLQQPGRRAQAVRHIIWIIAGVAIVALAAQFDVH